MPHVDLSEHLSKITTGVSRSPDGPRRRSRVPRALLAFNQTGAPAQPVAPGSDGLIPESRATLAVACPSSDGASHRSLPTADEGIGDDEGRRRRGQVG